MLVVVMKRSKIRKGSKKGNRGGEKVLVLYFILYSPTEPKYTIKVAFAAKSKRLKF